MAKTAAQTLITNIAKNMADDSTDATTRADILKQLNISQHEILEEVSLRFMLTVTTLSVVSSSCAVPATIDASKTMTLSRVGGDGEIVYVETDRWYTEGVDTYGAITQTDPTVYTIAGSTFLFRPAGLTVSVPIIAQLRVLDLADTSGSTSQLLEGWEHSLLAIDAEAELRRVRNEPDWQIMKARAAAKREVLYAQERTTKQKPWPDREQKERKIEKAQLSDEAAP